MDDIHSGGYKVLTFVGNYMSAFTANFYFRKLLQEHKNSIKHHRNDILRRQFARHCNKSCERKCTVAADEIRVTFHVTQPK